MVEKIGTIKNPLTIIAIFAAIAEISGTVVLPFIAPANQSIYVWFLMIFPSLLVILFFATLNFNHRVLYAPSDYTNEDNFIRSLTRATFAEKTLQVEAELAELGESEAAGSQIGEARLQSIEQVPNGEVREASKPWQSTQSTYALAEELVFRKMSAEFPIPIQREVRISGKGAADFILDGIVVDKGLVKAIEIKLIRNSFSSATLERTVLRINAMVQGLPEDQKRNFRLGACRK